MGIGGQRRGSDVRLIRPLLLRLVGIVADRLRRQAFRDRQVAYWLD